LPPGRALKTPFGTIYTTNITPDPAYGIGRWPEEAFVRAMREGVRRNGDHLYPAFPYPHFTLMNGTDIHALYAYIETQAPVPLATPPNRLTFPFNIRPLIAAWKLLYFRERRFAADPAKSELWNRGAYLAEGLGHCGACHTPLNALGAEREDSHFAGGLQEGWYAYALNGESPAPIRWTPDSLALYLRRGWHEKHGLARGPMVPVVENLGSVSEAYTNAIAAYIGSAIGSGGGEAHQPPVFASRPAKEAVQAETSADGLVSKSIDPQMGAGAKIYETACARCHEAGRPLPFGAISLSLSSGLTGPTPHNLTNVTLYGLQPRPGEASPVMPPFHAVMDSTQLEALLRYMRTAIAAKPAWDDPAGVIKQARDPATAPELYFSPGTAGIPADPGQAVAPW